MYTKQTYEEAPNALKEFILATEFGWTLEYIREMTESDKEAMFMMAIVKLNLKNFDIINMMSLTTTGKPLISKEK